MSWDTQTYEIDPILDIERRKDTRIKDALPIFVTGRDRFGRRFSFRTATWDIGARGLRAIAPQVMRVGEELTLRIRFAKTSGTTTSAPEATAQCVVLRSEARSDGACVFAASFLKKRML
ncbi:MAG: hypothetical protein LBT74_10620 [Acidobacteriota bacterium]|jgi:hypothetical protein|nr:hypothetical protein [Acidobacteriota bacterium]